MIIKPDNSASSRGITIIPKNSSAEIISKAFNKAKSLVVKPAEEVPEAPTTKICPFCKSEISIDATRCPHCTSELEK